MISVEIFRNPEDFFGDGHGRLGLALHGLPAGRVDRDFRGGNVALIQPRWDNKQHDSPAPPRGGH